MANSNNPYGFKVYQKRSPAGEALEELELGSNVGVKAGDPLYIDSSGDGQRALTTQAIMGIAQHDVTAVAATRQKVLYYPATEDTTFVCQSVGTTNITNDMFGVSYDLTGSSGAMGINAAGTTGPVMRVIGVKPGTDLGTYAQLLVKVTKSQYVGQA